MEKNHKPTMIEDIKSITLGRLGYPSKLVIGAMLLFIFGAAFWSLSAFYGFLLILIGILFLIRDSYEEISAWNRIIQWTVDWFKEYF